MSHRSPVADTKDRNSSALKYAAGQLHLLPLFLPLHEDRRFANPYERMSRAETSASPTDIGKRTACGIASISSQELGAVSETQEK